MIVIPVAIAPILTPIIIVPLVPLFRMAAPITVRAISVISVASS